MVDAFGGEDGADLGLALGEGSGLIDDQRVDLFHRLQGFRVADQDALPGAAAGAHHDGHGRSQAEGTGAGNDEHSDCVHQGMRVPRLRAKHGPDGKGDCGRCQHRWDEVRSYPVGQALNGRSAPLRLAYHFYDLGQECGRANALGFHHQAAGSVDRSTDYFVSGGLFYRDGFAGDHGFIYGAAPFGHHAIDRHFLAWANAQQIAYRDLADGDIGFASVCGNTTRGFGRQAKEGLDRAAGLAAGSQLQHLAQQDQYCDDGGGFEIETEVSGGITEGGRKEAGGEHRSHTVEVGCSASDRDEGEHVQAAMNDRSPTALEEGPSAPQDHRGRQD